MSVRVDIIPWQHQPALVEKWRECVTKADNFRAWMQTPEWLDFHWRPYAKTYLAALRDGRSRDPIAVTPLVEKPCPLQFSIAGRMLGSIHINGLLVIGNEPLFPASDEYYEALIDAALAVPSVDCLYMLGVPKTSPFWAFLAKAQKMYPQWLFYTPGRSSHRYFYIETSMSHDEYMSKFKRDTKKNFKRKLHLLQREAGGKVEIVRTRCPDEVSGFLNAAHAVARKSWQHQLIEIDVDQAADRQEFLELMARQGLLRSYTLKADDKAVAYKLAFQLNGIFYFHETAYDPAYTHFSPGISLTNLAIEDCFKCDKPKRIYFGPGENSHKAMLSNQIGEEVTIVIFRNTIVNKAKITGHHLFRRSIEMAKVGLARAEPIAARHHEAS